MIESHIDDGDYVVIRISGAERRDRGPIIDNDVTLMRFYREHGTSPGARHGEMQPSMSMRTQEPQSRLLVGVIRILIGLWMPLGRLSVRQPLCACSGPLSCPGAPPQESSTSS